MHGARNIRTAAAFALALTTIDARADDKQQCLAASEKAQELRNAGKLSDAREQLAICGRAQCPKLVQQDCTQWMSEVLTSLPSVVPGATDGRGRDLVDVTVTIDGKVVADTLDGKPIAVDPGVHTFRFETRGAPPVEQKVVVRQGEKNRIVSVTFADASPSTGAPTPSAARPDAEKPSPPVAAYVLGGLGLAAIGAAVYVAVDANADALHLRDECAPRCNQSDVDSIERRRVVAGITGAAGGAMLVAGVVLFFVHERARSRSRALATPIVAVAPAPGGASGVATVTF